MDILNWIINFLKSLDKTQIKQAIKTFLTWGWNFILQYKYYVVIAVVVIVIGVILEKLLETKIVKTILAILVVIAVIAFCIWLFTG